MFRSFFFFSNAATSIKRTSHLMLLWMGLFRGETHWNVAADTAWGGGGRGRNQLCFLLPPFPHWRVSTPCASGCKSQADTGTGFVATFKIKASIVLKRLIMKRNSSATQHKMSFKSVNSVLAQTFLSCFQTVYMLIKHILITRVISIKDDCVDQLLFSRCGIRFKWTLIYPEFQLYQKC